MLRPSPLPLSSDADGFQRLVNGITVVVLAVISMIAVAVAFRTNEFSRLAEFFASGRDRWMEACVSSFPQALGGVVRSLLQNVFLSPSLYIAVSLILLLERACPAEPNRAIFSRSLAQD